MALLEARGLEKWYGRRQVVNGVDFEVNQGEVVGLLGPNGAGKTTSFRMTIGLIDADGGNVVFDGRDVTHMPMYQRARSGMGFLAQDSSVFKQLSVEDNLMAILETRRHLNRRQRKDRQNELLAQFGLTHIRKTKANRVSGGERRRLEIARSLVTEPKLIMLDEPFAGHRPQNRQRDPGPDPQPRRRVQPRHPPDRPQLPRDDRGHRPQLSDPRGHVFASGTPPRSCSTPTSAATTSANGSTPATCSNRSSAAGSTTTGTNQKAAVPHVTEVVIDHIDLDPTPRHRLLRRPPRPGRPSPTDSVARPGRGGTMLDDRFDQGRKQDASEKTVHHAIDRFIRKRSAADQTNGTFPDGSR